MMSVLTDLNIYLEISKKNLKEMYDNIKSLLNKQNKITILCQSVEHNNNIKTFKTNYKTC